MMPSVFSTWNKTLFHAWPKARCGGKKHLYRLLSVLSWKNQDQPVTIYQWSVSVGLWIHCWCTTLPQVKFPFWGRLFWSNRHHTTVSRWTYGRLLQQHKEKVWFAVMGPHQMNWASCRSEPPCADWSSYQHNPSCCKSSACSDGCN